MKEDLQKLFSDFHNNLLSPHDRKAFNNRLSNDSIFKENYEIYLSMQTFLDKQSQHGEALHSLRNFHQDAVRQSHSNSKRTRYIIMGIIGILALLMSYYFTNKTKKVSSQALYAQIYEAPNWPSERGGNSTLEQAVYDFKNNNKKTAIDSFYNSKNITSDDKNYWLAELHLSQNQPDSTLHLIKKIENPVLKDRLLYLELMSYLLKDDIVALRKKLNNLPENISPFYQKRIDILSEKIN